MSDQLQCRSCGAPLRDIGFGQYRCEYCGSVYRREGETVFVETVHSPVQKIAAKITIPMETEYRIPKEELSKYTIRELTSRLAEGLAAFMKVEVERDLMHNASIVYGSVRVLPPDHRF